MTTRPVRRWRAVLRQVDALDTAVYAAIADTHSPALDRVMPALTDVADRSALWFGIAGLLAATRHRRFRRAALRGVLALAATSLIANQVSKRLHRRPRPPHEIVPVTRRSRRIPRSTSFPSGHAASAAAFAVGVTLEAPVLAGPLLGLAGLVGLSRVATGAHFPSDVLGGYALGAGVAALGARIVPPVAPPDRRAQQRATSTVEPRPTGAGVVLVLNPAAHSGAGDRVLRRLRRSLPDLAVVELGDGDDVEAVLDRAAAGAEVLGVAGGDGTVGAAAGAALRHDRPLVVFPAGTFNHFAKDAGTYPLRRAIRAVRAGTVAKVDVGYVNDGLFLNTASVGAYSDFVAIRERLEKRMGKPLAALVAAMRALRRDRAIRIRVDDIEGRVGLLFLGNGQYEPRGFAPAMRNRMDEGRIDLRLLEASRLVSRVKVVTALVTGQLSRNKRYRELSAGEFEIELLDGPARIARDGELGETADRLRVRVDRRALTVFRPR